MSNVFGPKKPLFGPYTYRAKQNSNGDTLIAVYHGSKRIAHIDAYWAYSMRAIEEHEAEEVQRASGSGGGRGRRLVCASDLRALGAEGRYPNVLAVGHAFIDDDAYKGKGIGRAMYEAMMVEGFAVRQTRIGGQPGPMFFVPDECKGAGNTSAEAQRVWASLARDYPSQGTSIRVDAPPVIGSRARANPRRRNPETVLTEKRNGVLVEREGGYLYAARKGSTLHVVTVELPESVRGMGHGISMYERLFDYAKKNGFTVVSYPTVELPAARVWEAMARRGYPVVRHPSAILVSSRDGDIDFWYVKGGNEQTPVFSVARAPREANPRRNGRGGTAADRTDPDLWEAVKREVTAGSKGGKPGQWSARKAQLAVALYKKRGGGYVGPKSPRNALAKWTREDWRTRSGDPSLVTGERYLPSRAIAALTPAEYAATTRAKRAGLRRDEQFTPQPERIAAKTARYRRNPEYVPLRWEDGDDEDDLDFEASGHLTDAVSAVLHGMELTGQGKPSASEVSSLWQREGVFPHARALYLHDVTVSPGLRGRGAGRRYVAKVEDDVRRQGAEVVVLHADHSLAFWQKQGYTLWSHPPAKRPELSAVMYKVLARANPTRRARGAQPERIREKTARYRKNRR